MNDAIDRDHEAFFNVFEDPRAAWASAYRAARVERREPWMAYETDGCGTLGRLARVCRA